jgi:endoglucanase
MITPFNTSMEFPFYALKPAWQKLHLNERYISEGDDITWTLACFNPSGNGDEMIVVWFTGPGNIGGNGAYVQDWDGIVAAECAKHGCTSQRLSSTTTPAVSGTMSFAIRTTPSYKGFDVMTFTNTVRRNRSDDQNTTFPDKTVGRDLQILLKGYGNGDIAPGSGSYIYVRDTSRRPTGVPAMNIYCESVDHGAVSAQLKEGDSFRVTYYTTNLIEGHRCKIYEANVGQKQLDPDFRTQLRKAALEAGCTVEIPQWTEATAGQWFNGGYVTWGKGYDPTKPMSILLTVKQDGVAEPLPMQWDCITNVSIEGDVAVGFEDATVSYQGNWNNTTIYKKGDWVIYVPTGQKFIYDLVTKSSANPPPSDGTTYRNNWWRQYTPVAMNGGSQTRIFADLPPRFWELRATSDGTTITYTLQGPANDNPSSVTLASVNSPPGFDSALQAALAASGFMSLNGTRLTTTNTALAQGAVTFTVPHAGTGKHTMRLTDPDLDPLVIPDSCVYLSGLIKPPCPKNLYGLNISGGEFGAIFDPTTGKKYAYNGGRYYYPSKPENGVGYQHERMDYYWSKGVRYARLPIRWERIQPVLMGPLYYGPDVPFTGSNDQDMRRIIEVINYWTNVLGGYILLDMHNFMEYNIEPYFNSTDNKYYGRGVTVRYNGAELNTMHLIDVWVKLALVFQGNPRVHFDLMNEPKDVNNSLGAGWARDINQAVMNAIRAQTNFTGLIHREMSEYASAGSFIKNGNGDANITSYDPANNEVYHCHSYNDSDGSGTSAFCVSGTGSGRISQFVDWLTAHNKRGFIGETAGGDPAQTICGPIMASMYQYMLDHKDVLFGWTTWGSGFPLSYIYHLDPDNNNYSAPVDSPSMKMLAPYLAQTQDGYLQTS